ncbi:Inositol-1-monophosphatase [Alphaproteobacteria bacterium SO-S41]|nr:Inositol-1-monophosphatase [Alphaproteobacteria bacterium SO-S41]
MRDQDLADRDLLIAAARAAGAVLLQYFGTEVKVWNKGGTPVTEADHASNALLLETLSGARPDYGWVSEETADDSSRLSAARVFVVDPLDGTVSFIKHKDDFTVSLAVVEDGVPVAGAVFNPSRNEMYAAALGGGATLNGAPIHASAASAIEGCRMVAARDMLQHPAWPEPWPPMEILKIGSIAYRLAAVASGAADATMALSTKSDWDIAGGEIIAREAGALVTRHDGSPFRYNGPTTNQPSLVGAAPGLYPALSARVGQIKLRSSQG